MIKNKKKTSYNINQVIENEKGWLFYDTNLKLRRILHNLLKGSKILDLGCGSALSISISKIFNPNLKIEGFEEQESVRPIWKKRGAKVTTGKINKLPFENNSFDTVYSSHVLEHLKDPNKAILESIRVSKKRVIHIVPEGNVNEKNFGTPHLKVYNRKNFLSLFKKYNLKIIKYESVQDTHMNSLIICLEKNEN